MAKESKKYLLITLAGGFPPPQELSYTFSEGTRIYTEENGILIVEQDGETEAIFAPGHWKYLKLVKDTE